MTFYSRIKKLRIDNGLSQDELAKKLNVSRQAVSKWESGVLPDVNNLVKISKFFDCSIDYLLNTDSLDNTNNTNHLSITKKVNIIPIITFIVMILAIFVIIVLKLISIIYPSPLVRQSNDGSWYVGFVGFIDYHNLRETIIVLFITIIISLSVLTFEKTIKRFKERKLQIKADGLVLIGYIILISFISFCMYEILYSSYFTMNMSEIFLSIFLIITGILLITLGNKRMECKK